MLSSSVCLNAVGWWSLSGGGGGRQKGQSQSSHAGFTCKLLNYSCLSTSLATSHRCNCLHAVMQNRLLVGKVHFSHRYIIFTTKRNPWIHPLTRARQTSASDVVDLKPTGLFFSEFLCPRRTAQECRQHPVLEQKVCTGKTQRLRNESWSLKLIIRRSMCEDQTCNDKQMQNAILHDLWRWQCWAAGTYPGMSNNDSCKALEIQRGWQQPKANNISFPSLS